MKKLFIMLLLCVTSVANAFADEWTDENGVVWSYYNTDGGVYLVDASNYGESFSIPSKIDGKDIKIIGGIAFQDCKNLKNIADLPECTSIEAFTFSGCSNLTSIGDLPSCTTIGNCAFYCCKKLERIGNLSSCTSIDNSAFEFCSSLTTIGDLSACISIGSSSFAGCSSLADIGDFTACTTIGGAAFSGCTNLTCINLPACSSIGSSAFYNCKKLTSVGNLTNCITIGPYAFACCISLTNLEINSLAPPVLADINVFWHSPTTIIVPSSSLEAYRTASVWSDIAVQIIPDNVITDYTGVNKLTVSAQETGSGLLTALRDVDPNYVMNLEIEGTINSYDIFAMRNKMANLHVLDMTNVDIVANTYPYYENYYSKENEMMGYEFNNLNKLVEVMLPKSVKNVGHYTFTQCGSLANVVLPEGIEGIDSYAFFQTALNNISLPDGITYIDEGAFANCLDLEDVQFPNTLKTIGDVAFQNCYNIIKIDLPTSLQRIERGAFSSCM